MVAILEHVRSQSRFRSNTGKEDDFSKKKPWQNLKHRIETKNYSRRGSTIMRTRLTATVLDDKCSSFLGFFGIIERLGDLLFNTDTILEFFIPIFVSIEKRK